MHDHTLSTNYSGTYSIYLRRYTEFYLLPYRHSGLGVKQYRYYDPATCGFDFKGCMEDVAVS